jgi:hypothetical protein
MDEDSPPSQIIAVSCALLIIFVFAALVSIVRHIKRKIIEIVQLKRQSEILASQSSRTSISSSNTTKSKIRVQSWVTDDASSSNAVPVSSIFPIPDGKNQENKEREVEMNAIMSSTLKNSSFKRQNSTPGSMIHPKTFDKAKELRQMLS